MTEQTEKRLASGKKLGGRPSLYKPEYCEDIINFFTVDTYRKFCVKEIENTKTGIITREYEERGGDLKFLTQYARSIGVTIKTLENWANENDEFFLAYNNAKALQKEHLIQNGVQGNYNPAFSIFTAKNITDMKDAPLTVINNENHTHLTSIKIENLQETELVDLITGRVNGLSHKPA